MTKIRNSIFFSFPVSNFKYNFIFFNFKFVTWRRNNKRLPIDLVTQSEFFFQRWVSNLKAKQQKFNDRVSNSTFNVLFFNFELVTRTETPDV